MKKWLLFYRKREQKDWNSGEPWRAAPAHGWSQLEAKEEQPGFAGDRVKWKGLMRFCQRTLNRWSRFHGDATNVCFLQLRWIGDDSRKIKIGTFSLSCGMGWQNDVNGASLNFLWPIRVLRSQYTGLGFQRCSEGRPFSYQALGLWVMELMHLSNLLCFLFPDPSIPPALTPHQGVSVRQGL